MLAIAAGYTAREEQIPRFARDGSLSSSSRGRTAAEGSACRRLWGFVSQGAGVRSGKYYVYILASKSRTLYVGVTNDLKRRVYEHKHGVLPGFTSRYRASRLVYFEETENVGSAIPREKQIKQWRREKKVALVEAVNPTWDDLSAEWFEGESKADPSLPFVTLGGARDDRVGLSARAVFAPMSSHGRSSADNCTPSGRSPSGRTACAPWHRPPPFVPREPAARRCETAGQVCSAAAMQVGICWWSDGMVREGSRSLATLGMTQWGLSSRGRSSAEGSACTAVGARQPRGEKQIPRWPRGMARGGRSG